MDQFEDKIAVITGAGGGMGRDLALALASEGTHLALCDLQLDPLTETVALCRERNPKIGIAHATCDVTDEDQLIAFRRETTEKLSIDHIHLLFNNAGIGTTESFIDGNRAVWEQTFDVCWRGVYLSSRVFVPLVIAAPEGHIINTSSVNGFWASLGPSRTHTAYSAAKFAVRGFTEALMTELRLLAPHVGISVVMPGHIGTEIVANTHTIAAGHLSPEASERAAAFRNSAPTTSADAADIILDGVRQGQWRILVGHDAEVLDEMVRSEPERAYEQSFVDDLHAAGVFEYLVE